MRIVTASAVLVSFTPQAEQLIESAGRCCYKSEDKITDTSAAEFIKMIMKRGHESVLEHASASFRIVCDRGVSHEIVRHRLASYSQESTRYCNYGKEQFGQEIQVIQPPGLDSPPVFTMWQQTCEVAENTYLLLLNHKVPPQIARSILPTCLKTELVMTCNFREWRHFLKLRTSAAAHPQMREVAEMIKAQLQNIAPTVFAD